MQGVVAGPVCDYFQDVAGKAELQGLIDSALRASNLGRLRALLEGNQQAALVAVGSPVGKERLTRDPRLNWYTKMVLPAV